MTITFTHPCATIRTSAPPSADEAETQVPSRSSMQTMAIALNGPAARFRSEDELGVETHIMQTRSSAAAAVAVPGFTGSAGGKGTMMGGKGLGAFVDW